MIVLHIMQYKYMLFTKTDKSRKTNFSVSKSISPHADWIFTRDEYWNKRFAAKVNTREEFTMRLVKWKQINWKFEM